MKNAYCHLALLVGMAAAAASLAAAEEKKMSTQIRCIPLHQIKSTEVVDDQTIKFQLRNGKVYTNHLPHRCNSLSFYKAFTYATSQSELCNVDIISAVDSSSGEVRKEASCGLGMFELSDKQPALKNAASH